ncbi:hypothetical protein BDZ94DRAFT_1313134 [Collybia nuda]|uniref:Uncharacterized protein n=1 Tax=Collybia nuda TaxID=64659 RepID=A0A9P5XWX8_9AGAR|nr:hypothetical protein BDZ94DRAFT_1313134 [Collybia nuda]
MPDLITPHLGVYESAADDLFDTIQAENQVPCLEELNIEVHSAAVALKFLWRRWSNVSRQGIHRGTIYLGGEIREDDEAAVAQLEATMIEMGNEMSLDFI